MDLPPFTPAPGKTVTVSGSTTSASTAIDTLTLGGQVLCTNAGTVVAFVKAGVGAQTATSADMPLAGGTSRIITVPAGTDTVAGITATSTANLYFTPGHGQ